MRSDRTVRSRRFGLSAVPYARIGALRSVQVAVDAVADTGCRSFDGVAGEVRVPGGRLHLGMTEQLADHRQGLPERQITGCEGVTRIVYDGSTGVICKPMLSPTREPEALTESFARCAYRAVVCTWV